MQVTIMHALCSYIVCKVIVDVHTQTTMHIIKLFAIFFSKAVALRACVAC